MQALLLLCAFAATSAHPKAAVKVTVDISEAPDAARWAAKAKSIVEHWHPRISRLLASDGYTPPAEVQIVLKKDLTGVAYASGRMITIAVKWITDHPEDYGMVVHELTHVIQGYRRAGPSWLVEGIADYVRFAHYEPNTPIRINTQRASYRDGYRTTATFLAWLEKTHDKAIIRRLNKALRAGKYNKDLFKASTAKTLDDLWAAFLADQQRK
jgi:hypothetical protein